MQLFFFWILDLWPALRHGLDKKFQHKKIVPRKKSKTRVIDSISNLNNMIKKQATIINKLRKKVTIKKKGKKNSTKPFCIIKGLNVEGRN